jgi:uncharacterized protein
MTDITVRKARWSFPETLDDVFAGDLSDDCSRLALSLTLPHLEPYLIRTMRAALPRLGDGPLADDVRAFCGQEAQHHRNHAQVNEVVKRLLGSPTADRIGAIEADLEADYRRYTAEKPLAFNLAYAEGFEAMTCAMGLANLAEGRRPPRFGPWQQLWAWHLAEEIEHRTVAFDAFHHVVGSYPYRVRAGLGAQLHFLRHLDRLHRVLMAHHGRATRLPHVPRLLRVGWRQYLRTFTPDYDPGRIETPPAVPLILAAFAPTADPT